VVPAEATHGLRRRVLREGRADAVVVFPEDHVPGAFHLCVTEGDGGPVIAVASFSPGATAARPGRRAFRLRGMAVEPAWQGRGVGRVLFRAAVDRLRASGAEVLWANSRDSALDFYRCLGMEVVGEGFVTEIGLPHHLVILDLA
jgi:GNAT superfamily N-acetyltransferase